MIPALTDHELEPILAASREGRGHCGQHDSAQLPREVADQFQEWMAGNFPTALVA